MFKTLENNKAWLPWWSHLKLAVCLNGCLLYNIIYHIGIWKLFTLLYKRDYIKVNKEKHIIDLQDN